MLKYKKPVLMVFTANNIRAFKAAALSCVSEAVSCGTAACVSTGSDNSCHSDSVYCTTSGTARAKMSVR